MNINMGRGVVMYGFKVAVLRLLEAALLHKGTISLDSMMIWLFRHDYSEKILRSRS